MAFTHCFQINYRNWLLFIVVGEKPENFSHFSSLFNNKTEQQSTSLKNETNKYADKNRPYVAYIDFLVVCQQSKTASA